MAILFFTDEVKLPDKFPKRKLKQWIHTIINNHQKETGNIGFIFCTDQKILEINNQFLNHNYFTDIITFDYNENNTINGEIYISYETVKTNSIDYKTNFLQELFRVMIHGVLHLCGIKDKRKREKKIMKEEENKALKVLQKYINF